MDDQRTPDESHCSRCKRPNPEFGEQLVPVDWESFGNELLCPGCLTGAEVQMIMEDEEETAREAAGEAADWPPEAPS